MNYIFYYECRYFLLIFFLMKNIDLEPPGLNQNIPLLQLIPNNKTNRYFYENGHYKLIPRLTLKVHSDVEECYNLWEKFSPRDTLFDLWDFCYSWYQGLEYKPYFYTLYEGQKPVGVLPLCYDDREDKRFEWFGCEWLENHKFFVEDKKLIDFFLKIVPTPVYLNSIAEYEEIRDLAKFGKLRKEKDSRNIKNISKMKSLSRYLYSLLKKNRYHLKSDYQKLISIGARVQTLETKDLTHFEELLRMSKIRFDGVERSRSYVKRYEEAFRWIIRNSGVYKFKYIKVYVQNRLASVDMIITYKDIYYPFQGSNDVYRFSGIGNFMTYIEMEDAIKGEFKLVDILQEDHGWKHKFFDQIPVYVFKK